MTFRSFSYIRHGTGIKALGSTVVRIITSLEHLELR